MFKRAISILAVLAFMSVTPLSLAVEKFVVDEIDNDEVATVVIDISTLQNDDGIDNSHDMPASTECGGSEMAEELNVIQTAYPSEIALTKKPVECWREEVAEKQESLEASNEPEKGKGGSKPDNNTRHDTRPRCGFRTVSVAVSSNGPRSISFSAYAIANSKCSQIGVSSLKIQRYYSGRWMTIYGIGNQYMRDTNSFALYRTLRNASSGSKYRVLATFVSIDYGRMLSTRVSCSSGAVKCR